MTRLLFAALLLSSALPAIAGTITARCSLSILPGSKRLFSRADVTYVSVVSGPGAQEPFDLQHYITNTTAAASGAKTTPYTVSLTSTETAVAGQCYQAVIFARADDSESNGTSPRVCAPVVAPAPAPSPSPAPCTSGDPMLCTGGGGGGGGGGIQTRGTDECYYDVYYGSVCNSPLVVNLGYGTYRFSGASDPVTFDLDADGRPDSVTWTEGLSDVAFLALDRNGNGTFDSGAELFGNHTPKQNGSIAANGFDALADFDENGDDEIDANDSIWPRLRLWIDQNHDGRASAGEITTPAAVGVTSFGLDYHWTGRRDQHGNVLRYKGLFTRDGSKQPYYDVYLRMLQ